MNPTSETADILRAARALLGLSQAELADKTGLSRRTIMRIEVNAASISVGTLAKLRAAFEREGIEFLPETTERGPAIGKKRSRSIR